MRTLAPNLAILPAPQRQLWPELKDTPQDFTLYGGTALALRLGHRTSVDFDFFSTKPFDPERLAGTVPYLRDAERVQVEANTLTCRIDRQGSVLVSFFGGLRIGQVAEREQVSGIPLFIASMLDIAGAKAAVIQKRAEIKDYIDIEALLQHGIDLPTMLAAGSLIYGRTFNPLITLKAVGYFGDVPGLSPQIQSKLTSAVARVDVTRLPKLVAYSPVRLGNGEAS